MSEKSMSNRVRLYSRLQHTAHRLKVAADNNLGSTAGLTTAQTAILVTVRELASGGETVMQRQIAQALGLNESAVTAMVRKLISSGHLERQRSPADGRAWSIGLTDQGWTSLADSVEPFSEINRALDGALGDEGVAQLADLLDRVIGALNNKP